MMFRYRGRVARSSSADRYAASPRLVPGAHNSTLWSRSMSYAHRVCRLARVAFVALLTVPAVGCGLFLVHGPPPPSDQTAPLKCTQRNTGPLIDVAAAALSGVLVVVAATEWSDPDSYYYYASDDLAYAGAASGTLFGVSAVVGFLRTRKCRDAIYRLQSQGLQVPRGPTASQPFGPALPHNTRLELPGVRRVNFPEETGAGADQRK